jgi:hypothetical protein
MLTLHVMVSVGWLGIDLGLLTLGIVALSTGDPQTLRACYLTMDVLGDVVIVPLSLLALLTGILLGLGTQWGLFRHYWILTKLVLTLIAATAFFFALRGQIAAAVEDVSGVPADQLSREIITRPQALAVAPAVALAIYVTTTILAIYKPWGRTPYGKRMPAARRR